MLFFLKQQIHLVKQQVLMILADFGQKLTQFALNEDSKKFSDYL